MRTKKISTREKLGVILHARDAARLDDDRKYVRLEGQSAPSTLVTEEEVAAIERLFLDVTHTLERFIVKGVGADALLGEVGLPVSVGAKTTPAVLVLERLCWPFRVPDAIRLPSNHFHYLWLQLCEWAASEELLVDLELVHQGQLAGHQYWVRARSCSPFVARS